MVAMGIGRVTALKGPEQVEVQTYEVPHPEPGAVVLAVSRANVCGSDVHQYHWESPALREAALGHEFVGRVVALGEGVTTDFAGQPVRVGDRVVPVYYLTCLRCSACLSGELGSCENAVSAWATNPEKAPHFNGAFATHYYVRPGQYFYTVPDEVDDATVAGANCGLAQMIYTLDRIGVGAGETLVIQGAGGLGLYAAAVAHERGAIVVAVDAVADRLELARRFGADHTIDLTELRTVAERAAAVRDRTGGAGADVVLEVAGVPAAFTEAIELVRRGGRIATVGNINAEADVSVIPGLITRKGITIRGVLRYDPWYLHRAVQFLARRRAIHPFDALTDRSYPLDDVVDALRAGESHQVARVAIVP
jgi:threonine dehydrogenase-like Zn-dependent dehydrogenase